MYRTHRRPETKVPNRRAHCADAQLDTVLRSTDVSGPAATRERRSAWTRQQVTVGMSVLHSNDLQEVWRTKLSKLVVVLQGVISNG